MNEEMDIPLYNIWKDEYNITVKAGEVICPKCKGSGIAKMKIHQVFSCKLCFGQGKVDWIKGIRGRK